MASQSIKQILEADKARVVDEQRARQADRTQDRVEVENVARRRRDTDFSGVFYRLGIPYAFRDPNYVYYWANDVPGRLEQLTKFDDWDFVNLDKNNKVISSSETSTALSHEVGVDGSGHPMRAYLLRKRKIYFEEDELKRIAAMDANYQRMTEVGFVEGPNTLADDKGHAYRIAETRHAYPVIRRV